MTRLPQVLDAAITPRRAGLAGLATMIAVLGGAFGSLAQFPGYSVLRDYVSALARASNPGSWLFSAGLFSGGLLLLPFAWGLRHLAANPHGRRAAGLAIISAVGMLLVGLFDLTRPVAHFTCAGTLFAAAIFATLLTGLGLLAEARAAERPGPRRLAGRILVGLFVLQLLMTAVGFAHTASAYRHVKSTDPAEILKELPPLQEITLGSGGLVINPVAVLEWTFLIMAMGLVLAASVALLLKR